MSLFHAAITSAVLGLYSLVITAFSKTSCFLHSARRIVFCFHTEQQVKLWVCIMSLVRSYLRCEIICKASPKRYRTFAIVRQWAGAGRLRRWCYVAWTFSFILTQATSRHFQWIMSYAALSERVFSALGDFLQVEKWRILKSNVFAWNSVWNWENPNYLLWHFSESFHQYSNNLIAPDWLRRDSVFVPLSADAAQILRQHDASSVFRSKSCGMNFYRCLLLQKLHG